MIKNNYYDEPIILDKIDEAINILVEQNIKASERTKKYLKLINVIYPNCDVNLIFQRTSRKRELVEPRYLFFFLMNKIEKIRISALVRMTGYGSADILWGIDKIVVMYDTEFEFREALKLVIGETMMNKIKDDIKNARRRK